MTISVLKAVKQIVYQFSEKTPPNIKYSKRNFLVAKVTNAIDLLIVDIQASKKKK